MSEKGPDSLIIEALGYLRNWQGQVGLTKVVNDVGYIMVDVSKTALQEVIDLLQETLKFQQVSDPSLGKRQEAEAYSRELLRQARTFEALASLMRRKPPHTKEDLAMILVAEGLVGICEGLAEMVKEEK